MFCHIPSSPKFLWNEIFTNFTRKFAIVKNVIVNTTAYSVIIFLDTFLIHEIKYENAILKLFAEV